MLRTIEEVKKGLECCQNSRQNIKPNKCSECPYKHDGVMNYRTIWKVCNNELAKDALFMLKQLQKDVEYYKEHGGRDADKI